MRLIDADALIDAIMGQPPEPHYPSWYAAQIEKIPAVQPDHNADVGKKVADEDCISRQMAIEAMGRAMWAKERLEELPSAQLDGIPLEWIDKHLEWLDNCDNDFAQLAKVSIKAMVELWKKDRI